MCRAIGCKGSIYMANLRDRQLIKFESKKQRAFLIGLFAFLSVFSFFKTPIFPDNEIIPFYLVPALLLIRPSRLQGGEALILVALTFVGLMMYFISDHPTAITDSLQLVVVTFALMSFKTLSFQDRQQFLYVLRRVVYFVTFLSVVQKLDSRFVDLVYQYLTNRDGSAEHLITYSGGVPGIAPEPAYMAAFLVGAYVIHKSHEIKRYFLYEICLLFSITLTASLTGMFFMVTVVIFFTKDIKEAAVLFLIVATVGIYLIIQNPLVLIRMSGFLEILKGGELSVHSLTIIDEAYGSARFFSLVEPLTSACCGAMWGEQYQKSYSPFSVAFYLIAPFHLFALPLLYKRSRSSMASIFLFIFSGPVLNWMCLAGCIKPFNETKLQEKKSIVKNKRRFQNIQNQLLKYRLKKTIANNGTNV